METSIEKRLRRDWTTIEVSKLRRFSKLKAPIAEIENALQRSESALRQKAHELGIALGECRKRDR